MTVILAKTVEPTISTYKYNDTKPQKVFKWIEEKLEHQQTSNNLIHSLFNENSIGYQFFDEALDVFRNIL